MEPRAVAALARVGALAAPVTLAGEQVLPVAPALAELFPAGLRRGSALGVTGDAAVSVALALVAAATADGGWVAFVGVEGLGLGAAAGFGVAMDRVVVVEPGPAWPAVMGIAVDGFDLLVTRPPYTATASVWRRLVARARERGGVVLAVDPPATFEVVATVTANGAWQGPHDGAGRLVSRPVEATIGGRGAFARVRRATLLLPGPTGAASTITPAVPAGGAGASGAAGGTSGAESQAIPATAAIAPLARTG